MRAMIFGFLLLAASPAFAQDQAPAAPADTTTAPADSTAAPADTTAAPAEQIQQPPEPALPDMTGPQIVISTAMGDITLQLDSVRAPKTTADIVRYVKAKHYDNTVFYRVVKGALIQMGSWDAKGKPRNELPGRVPLESSNGLSNIRGSVGLARGDTTDSGGADFFINVGDESPLDAAKDMPPNTTGYAVFGKVIAGMDIVDRINAVAVGGSGPFPEQAPMTPILVSKVSIVPGTDNTPAAAKKVVAKPAAKKK
jgi:cyclophilin family peptidyl-prolyl cis-trans isomerase